MPPPSTPSQAVHHFQRFCQRSGIGTSGHLVRFWAMLSPPHRHHIATDRPAASDHRAAPRRSAIMPASSTSSSIIQVVRIGQSKRNRKRGNQGEGCRRYLRPFIASLLSVALTVHAIARSSLPSSSAVPVILRPDLVRSLSSVRPSVFLFLVPRSPSCRLTAKPSPAAHYLTRSHPRKSWKGSPRPVLVVIPSPQPRHRSTSNRGGRTSARPSARLSIPVW